MSSVTDLFLFVAPEFDPGEDPVAAGLFAAIDDWMSSNGAGRGVVRLDDNSAAYGGGKAFQAGIWSGAFNHFNVDRFIVFLRTLEFPCWAQLLYQREQDSGFTLVDIRYD